jgi:DNA-binding NarL/FixJ family response regulator
MQNHFIIGESTLLSKGLNLVLEDLGQTEVGSASFDEIRNQKITFKDKLAFLWIVVFNEKKTPLEICKQIKKEVPFSKIFVFCESKDPIVVRDFLRTGISGYFLPQCNTTNINEAIGQTEMGNIYIDPKLRVFLSQNILGIGKSNSALQDLTKREKQILNLIVEENTTQEIANKLFISFCTVETHRLHLIQKLGVRNTAGLVREAVTQNIYEKSMNSMTF